MPHQIIILNIYFSILTKEKIWVKKKKKEHTRNIRTRTNGGEGDLVEHVPFGLDVDRGFQWLLAHHVVVHPNSKLFTTRFRHVREVYFHIQGLVVAVHGDDFATDFHRLPLKSLEKIEYFNLVATTIKYIADLNHGRWPAGLVTEVVYVVMLASTSPNHRGDCRSWRVDPLTRWACCGFFHCEIFFL